MRKIIFGTDWYTDCDDCVAMRILARAHKRGEICLLGIGINACLPNSVASLDGFLETEGVGGIPIGIDLDAVDPGVKERYQTRLKEYAKRYKCNEDAECAARLYRRLLAEADVSDGKVDIVEVGFLQVLGAFLLSGPDALSDKSGIELMREKVGRIFCMGGAWNREGGREYNLSAYERTRRAAAMICEKSPVPITFLGGEVGASVITGARLRADDVLKIAMCDHGSANGRSSWDPMTAELAVIGDEAAAGYDVVTGTARIDPETGANYFTPSVDGRHRYVVKKYPDEYYRDRIDELIR